MSHRTTVTYLYDGSFEGLLTAVFDAWKQPSARIVEHTGFQQQLGEQYVTVETQPVKFSRVYKAILAKLGQQCLRIVYLTFLSHDEERASKILAYLRLGFRVGRGINRRLADQEVLDVQSLATFVSNERIRMMEFIRFSLYEGGIYYAHIQPRNHVLPLIMSHFADRLSSIPFIIHDAGRNLAGVWDTREWMLVPAGGMNLPHLHEDEMKWQRMWKRFYDKVAVEGRINPKLRRQMMPKRYWENMCEMNVLPEDHLAQ